MTWNQQGLTMVIENPAFWLAVIIAAVLSGGFAWLRRKARKYAWYEPQLPVITAIGIVITIAPIATFLGWGPIILLAITFVLPGLIQWYECVSWLGDQELETARKQALKEAHNDPEKEVA
jgi:hypothetical protein